MNWKRKISCGISELSSLALKFRGFKPGFRVLMYHAVGTYLSDDPLGIYNIDPDLFRSHMNILVQAEYISLVRFNDGQGSRDCLEVAVTFDDGYKDNLYVAAPIMQELGIPFTVFVSTAHTKNDSKQCLNEAELKELANIPGAMIGAHGEKHLALANCSPLELKSELYDSKHYLEDVLGKPVRTMSYPFGSINRQVRDAVAEAGYIRAGCSRMDINDASRDRLLLCRTMIDARDYERIFAQKLNGDWDWHRWLDGDVIIK